MIVGVKGAMGVAGAAEVSCAVVVPLSLHTTTSTSSTTSGSQIDTTVKVDNFSQLSIEECTTNELKTGNTIVYGELNVQKICGKREGVSTVTENSQVYSDLFQSQGGSRELDGDKSENHNQGTKQCFSDILRGAIVTQGVENQYLGFCDDSKDDEIKFVKKVKENSGEGRQASRTISICDRACGERVSDGVSGSPKVFERETSNSGEGVTFYNL